MQDPEFVHRAFANIAPRYVVTNHVLSLGLDRWWRRVVAREAAALAPESVLDLATGSGDLALSLGRALPGVPLLAADFCAPMLLEAARAGVRPLVVADGMKLPLQDGAVDLVTVAFGLRNMASWPGALREMRRVLRPGGHLLVLDFSMPSGVAGRLYDFYLGKVMPRVAGWITGRREAYEYLNQSIRAFPSGGAMVDLQQDCGFDRVRARPLTLGVVSLYIAEAA